MGRWQSADSGDLWFLLAGFGRAINQPRSVGTLEQATCNLHAVVESYRNPLLIAGCFAK
jgi:hypothetical protein